MVAKENVRGGREKGRNDGIKDGEVERGREGEGNVSRLPYQSICSIKINLNVICMSSPN